jgi:hypothetical protein
MSCVFRNIEHPPPRGVHTRRAERGVGGQYFERRKTQLCTLPISNPLCSDPSTLVTKAPLHTPQQDYEIATCTLVNCPSPLLSGKEINLSVGFEFCLWRILILVNG